MVGKTIAAGDPAETMIMRLRQIREINSPVGFPKKCAKLAKACAADLLKSDKMAPYKKSPASPSSPPFCG
jgi:hypothetical protein